MSEPLDHSVPSRRLKLVGTALMCAALVWLVGVRGYADYLSSSYPQRAVALNPNQPVAATQLAARAIDAGDLDTAEALATRVAAQYPFEGRALRVLGAIEERRGAQDRAERLMNAAAQASPRDTATQYWLALRALSEQDLDQALKRLDRVLRFQPETISELFPLLGTIAANPFGARKLLPYLSLDPAWRKPFLKRFVRDAQPIGAAQDLERLLAAEDSPMSSEESGVITGRLLGGGEWEQLSERIAKRSGRSAQQVRDPQFTGDLSEALLAWSWEKVVGVDVVFASRDEAGITALRMYFHDRRVPYRHLRQLLMLAPGAHRLDGRVRLDDLDTPRGMSWTIVCLESSSKQTLGRSERFRGSSPWRDFSLAFEVPAEDCPAQWLTLELSARIAAEQQIDGSVWFTDMRVDAEALGSIGTTLR